MIMSIAAAAAFPMRTEKVRAKVPDLLGKVRPGPLPVRQAP